MTITAPISTELGSDEIEIVADIQVTDSAVTVDRSGPPSPQLRRVREPLAPFLFLGVVSWLAIVVIASLLAF